MSERRRRLVLWCGALVLVMSLCIPKGHETPPGGAPSVAFLHGKTGKITVRLAGDVSRPGVYSVAAPGTVVDLIRQADPGLDRQWYAGGLLPATPLGNGDVVTMTRHAGAPATLAVGAMSARERMVLGVPLDPARMTASDWEALPGIGPALSERIVRYGRAGGGIHTLDELGEIAGIGERTIAKLRPLFKADAQ